MPWKRGAIPTPWKCGKGSYVVEVRRVVLSWLATSSTIKDSYSMEARRSSYTMEVWKVVPGWLVASSIIKGFLRHECGRLYRAGWLHRIS
nr:hypothetical protein CFP56_26843 [Quercus suber]